MEQSIRECGSHQVDLYTLTSKHCMNGDTGENDKINFLQEAAIMGQFHHPNIVQLYGVVLMGDPVSVLYLYKSL